jgi:lysozyme
MAQWKWCLVGDDNKLLTGWNKVGDYWYFLEANGSMKTGWYQDANGKWYYFNDKGQMMTGWLQYNSKYYYLYEATNSAQCEYIGTTAYSCTKTLSDGKSYTFDADGVMQEDTGYISDDCVAFIKGYEDFWSKADYDGTGYTDAQLTIGYGTTKASVPEAFPDGIKSTCTESDACSWLAQEINKMAAIVKADLDAKSITLTQNEFDGLMSFSYNCGESALLGSTLYKNVVAGIRDVDTITANFQAWSKAGGVTLSGLYKRRTAEANIFLNGVYDSTH